MTALATATASGDRPGIDSIYQEIRRRICTLVYPYGARLREAELGEEFGVSRTPIREVLQRLKADGLVEIRNGVGSIVIAGDHASFQDIYDLRIAIAEMIGTGSPALCESAAIAEMQALLAETRALRDSPNDELFWDINYRRHRVINGRVGNRELAKLHDLYYHKVAPFWFSLVFEDLDREIDTLEMEFEETIFWMTSGDVTSVSNIHRNHTAYSMARVQRAMATNAMDGPSSAVRHV
jgi:DNA-binding GntR family transcriptional regulator